MDARTFVDTNILIYARDSSEPRKQALAEIALRKLWENRNGRISIQVLNEYFVNVTQKLRPGLSRAEAWQDIISLRAWNPLSLEAPLMDLAYALQDKHALSWWDALIVAAAQVLECNYLLSVDLTDAQTYGRVTVINPLKIRL